MELLFIGLIISFWIFSYFVKPENKPKLKQKPVYKPKPIDLTDKYSILVPSEEHELEPNPMGYGNQFMSAQEKAAYLDSEEWQTLRFSVFQRDNYTCQSCGSKNKLNCHHITYLRLGAEWMTDLVTLCQECHSNLHLELGYDRVTIYPIKRK